MAAVWRSTCGETDDVEHLALQSLPWALRAAVHQGAPVDQAAEYSA
jgi:hypothetical protein